MPNPVDPRRTEVWTLFGRWRRRSPRTRALGVGLLLVSLLLTAWWASDADRSPPPDATGGAPAAASTTAAGFPAAGPPAAAAAACAPGAPADARPLTLPLTTTGADPWAPWVGRLVCLTHPLVVAEVFELQTRGRVLAAAQRPLATTTPDDLLRGSLVVRPAPGASAARLARADGEARAAGNGPWRLGPGDLRNGDALLGLVGRLGLEGGAVVLAAPSIQVESRNPRTLAPPDPGAGAEGTVVRVAGVNLLNWFLTLGDRGAATAAARDRQATKLVATLLALDADALALAEVENDRGEALDDLLRRLNEAQRDAGRDAASDYRAAPAPPGGSGRDAIRVAIAYRPAALTLRWTQHDGASIHDRPPLTAAFDLPDGRAAFTLVSVHQRSKGGCPATGDVDRGSGCWDLRRDAQSQALIDFTERLIAEGAPPALVVGDLNAYRHEAPTRRFADEGWLIVADALPPERAYSYVYFGRAGALDHAIAHPDLAPHVLGGAYWPINADEPPRADQDLSTPYRSSDHDPVVVALRWP